MDELKAIQAKLPELEAALMKARETLAGARALRDRTFEDLRYAVIGAGKVLELAAVSERKKPMVTRLGKKARRAAYILDAVADCYKALDGVAGDASVDKARKALTAAADKFAKANDAAKAARFQLKELSRDVDAQVETMGDKVRSYRAYIHTRVPRAERKGLRSRIDAVVPRTGSRRKTAKPAGTVQQNTTTSAATPVAA